MLVLLTAIVVQEVGVFAVGRQGRAGPQSSSLPLGCLRHGDGDKAAAAILTLADALMQERPPATDIPRSLLAGDDCG